MSFQRTTSNLVFSPKKRTKGSFQEQVFSCKEELVKVNSFLFFTTLPKLYYLVPTKVVLSILVIVEMFI